MIDHRKSKWAKRILALQQPDGCGDRFTAFHAAQCRKGKRMTELTQEILQNYQIRKTKAQKTAFIELMRAHFPELQVETGGAFKSRNLVIGDVKTAKAVFTAHYDTCAVLPFPNFITPKNPLVFLLYNLLICIPLFVVMVAVSAGLMLLTDSFWVAWLGMLAVFAGFFWIMVGGKPNAHTVNDNTSGVVTLCEILQSMTAEERQHAAFVFFDFEEAGMFGSSLFYKMHKAEMKGKLLVNFDCVSDGNNLLIIRSKKARKRYDDAICAAFLPEAGKNILLDKSATTLYPSDQMQFPCHVGVAALKRARFIGLYMDRIHTKRDTQFDPGNIEYLSESARRLTQALAKAE